MHQQIFINMAVKDLARAQAMADALPHARMVVVPGGGHASNLTHPEPVNAALTAFLHALP